MLIFALVILGLLIIAMVYRITLRSPNVFHKIQSINVANTLCIIFLIVYVYYLGKPELMDLGFIYLASNYLGTVIILKYMQTVQLYSNSLPSTPKDITNSRKD